MANDIFVLHKQGNSIVAREVIDFIRNLPAKVWESDENNKADGNTIEVKKFNENLIEENLSESDISSVLVCVINDEFFYDSQCREIWSFFWNHQKENKKQIMFPVYFDDIDSLCFHDSKKAQMLDEIKHGLGAYKINSNDMDLFYPLVYHSVISLKNSSPSNKGGDSNVHQITTPIPSEVDEVDEEDKAFYNLMERLDSSFANIQNEYKNRKENRKYVDKKPVCVIYTGGTAGSIHDDYGEIVEADMSKLIARLPIIKDFEVDIDFCRFEKLFDSSNMGSKHWIIIAKVIEKLYDNYQGFVIIQGVNTMAYTASALSFMLENIEKPIILTGSELPLTEPHSDAPQNIQKAIHIAAHELRNENINDICILFGRRLIKGNRATKQIALDTTEGFYAPNYTHDMTTISNDRWYIISPHKKFAQGNKPFKNNGQMSTKNFVCIHDVYPDMNMDVFKYICEHPKIEALILRTYGTGGVPDGNELFKKCLKQLQEADKLVVILTQCPRGSVEFRIAETNATLFNYGVISGGDMVTEAAYCKLKYLLYKFKGACDIAGKKIKTKAIKHYMMVNIKGELSTNMFIIDIEKINPIAEILGSFRIELSNLWAKNPALFVIGNNEAGNPNDFGERTFSKDSYADFPADPFFTSAVLRLSGVNIKKQNIDTSLAEIVINIDIFITKGNVDKLFERNKGHSRYRGNIALKIKENQLREKPFDIDAIDIDITNRANEILRKEEEFNIFIKCSKWHDEQSEETIVLIDKIEKINILLSVRDKARLDGDR
ncbi:MAG: asparaginase [Bacteroidales bacterium]|jgi:L-asparaginase|nr:asparaginase [Bacteroidales bacterium]